MIDALATVARVLEADDWQYELLEEPERLRAVCRGEHGEWLVHVTAPEDPGAVIVYSSCPYLIPEERLVEVGELLHRATWGLVLGAFELDLSDGEVRYRTGRALDDEPLGELAARTLLYENVLAMDRYLPAIEAVSWKRREAAAAILDIEGAEADE